jgi:hypothetical protein
MSDRRELATFVCSHVFANTSPVLLVAREGGDWMHLCGQLHQEDEEYHIVGIDHLIDRDPSLREVQELADDSEAERLAVGMPWLRRVLSADGHPP